jgi:hypothetical protein
MTTKTTLQWLELLQPLHRAQARTNMVAQSGKNRLHTSLYDALCDAFLWYSTPEEGKYWTRIAREINFGTYKLETPYLSKADLENLAPGDKFRQTDDSKELLFNPLLEVISVSTTNLGKKKVRYSYFYAAKTHFGNLIIGTNIDENGVHHLRTDKNKPAVLRKFVKFD